MQLTFDVFYRRQKDIGDPAVLRMIMDELGLDDAAFTQALTNGTFRVEVDQDWEAKSALNFKGIPAYQMNGEKIRGYHTPEEWGRSFWIRQKKPWRGSSARGGLRSGITTAGLSFLFVHPLNFFEPW